MRSSGFRGCGFRDLEVQGLEVQRFTGSRLKFMAFLWEMNRNMKL